MAEYSKEKRYYVKLPKDFFNEYYIKVLEGMPNGDKYLLMYLKLVCESISHGGYLRFSEEIPYTPEMIASITGTNVDVVRSGIDALSKLGLLTTTENGSLYLPKVAEMASITTKGAEEKAAQRKAVEDKKETSGRHLSTIDNRLENIDNRLETKEYTDYGDIDSTINASVTSKNSVITECTNMYTLFLAQKGYIRENDQKMERYNHLMENYAKAIGGDRLLKLLSNFVKGVEGKTIPLNRLSYIRASLENACKSLGIDIDALENDEDELF